MSKNIIRMKKFLHFQITQRSLESGLLSPEAEEYASNFAAFQVKTRNITEKLAAIFFNNKGIQTLTQRLLHLYRVKTRVVGEARPPAEYRIQTRDNCSIHKHCKGTTDPRIEFISQVLTQILMKPCAQSLNKS